MTILVDAGNSRVKWAWLERGAIDIGEPFATDIRAIDGQLQARWSGLPKPQAVYLSNVAGPEWERRFIGWIRRAWHFDVRVLRSGPEACGIVNAYEQSESLGVDRWVGLIGARARFGVPFCLIDCGTAVTVDLVDRDGHHRGGVIAPGSTLMKDALLRRAPGILAGVGSSECFWGRCTADGLESGSRETVLGLIGRALQQARITLGAEPVVVLTGGDAERMAPYLDVRYQLAPDLVLQGLAEIVRSECSTALRG